MNSRLTEENANAPTSAADEQPQPAKRAARAARRAPVAPRKGKAGKKATPTKKTQHGATKAKGGKAAATAGARSGSKTAKILELLRRKNGVSAKDLLKATGWQPHSLRGFLSGTVGKKMGLTVISTKGESGERVYSLKA